MKNLRLPVCFLVFCAALAASRTAFGQVADDPNSRPVAGIPVNDVEAKVIKYPLQPLLVLDNGQPVTDAATWFNQRRPEILNFFTTQVYGKIPATAPTVTWEVASVDNTAVGGTAILKKLVGHIGSAPDGPAIHVDLYLPAHATKPVPVLVGILFSAPPPLAPAGMSKDDAAVINQTFQKMIEADDPSTKDIFDKNPTYAFANPSPSSASILLAHGMGYAAFSKTDIETDVDGQANVNIVRKMALTPGQDKPADDEWGAIAAWAWGISHVVDYLQTDSGVDPKRIAITGGSRLGKTVLWAGVADPRIALVIACSSGTGGAKLAQRNYGESLAHLIAPTRYPYQFAANYLQYKDHPQDMPMDTHMLVAAMAPRPLLLHTAANGDNWSDPQGEFYAAVAASPAYELVGKKGLGVPADHPLKTGELIGTDLAFYLNNGGHAALNWDIALKFLEEHFHPEN